MAVDLLPIVLDLLSRYGLVAVFVLLVLDGAMLMPVLPGEAVMIMAVTQYVQDLTDLGFMIALTTVAAVVGSLLLYTISRVGGRPLIERHPRLFMMDKRRRESLEETFQKPLGQSLVLFLRVIPLTRIVVNIPAGLARMGVARFTVLSAIGMLVFHSGFLWLAFEFQQPGSAVAQQATALQDAYATPAWQYLQANEAVGILGGIALGSWFSFRSSRRMIKYPEGSVVSILGWLSVRVLLLGTLAVAAGLWYDPELVYELGLMGGLDIQHIARTVGYDPQRLLAYALGATALVGLGLRILEGWAKHKREIAEAAEDVEVEPLDEPADREEGADGGQGGELRFEDASG